MKLLYKPFAIIGAFISARIGRNVFAGLWSRIDDDDPPAPTAPEATLPKVLGAAALRAATMAVERGSARTFHYLTGYWPGEKKDKKDKKG
jgi:Protein of unknown function (DUF4235)